MNYRLKLMITISLLIALSLSLGGTLIISTSFRDFFKQETQAALHSFQSLQNTLLILTSLSPQTDYEILENALSQIGAQHSANWQALSLSSGNTPIFQSGNKQLLTHTLPLPEKEQCSYISISDAFGQAVLIKGILRSGEEQLELLARFDLSAVYTLRKTQQKQYFAIYSIVVTIGIIASAALSFVLTKHLRKLSVTTRQISEGNLSVRSKITANDEFGQLSIDFDRMADKLQHTICQLESDMQRQEYFIGAFAHELKTPMTSIIGFADLLRQGNMDENTRFMAANYIYSESKRLERLSFQLMDLIMLQKDAVVFRQVPVNRFLNEIQQALSAKLEAKNIQFICSSDPFVAYFEPDLVKSLLYNLVDNSTKAINNQGTIVIQATAIPGGCQFQVADNGRGMEQDELSKITEAFYRVDKARSRSQGGAGIGLALCKQIVLLHNGNLFFTSEPGKGTRVTVILLAMDGEENG